MRVLIKSAHKRHQQPQIVFNKTWLVIMGRFIVFFIFVAIFAASFQIGSFTEVDEEEAAQFLEEFEGLIEGIDAVGIFTHNTMLALPMFIPGFGIAWGLFSAWSTGFAFAAIASQVPEVSSIPPLAILFMSPFGVMELTAYSLAISRSYLLIRMIIKKVNLKTAIKPTAIEIGIVIGLLLGGGFIEFYMIEMAQESGFDLPGL